MAVAAVYHAHDDYDEEEEGYEVAEGEEYFINDDAIEHDDDEADEDDYGPGVTISWNSSESKKEKVIPVSDVGEEAYLDPLGLVNCWEEALAELKTAHPDRFFPPSEAPRSALQRHAKAPLWYGPSTIPNPAPIPSTSKLPPSTSTSTAPPSTLASQTQAYATSLPPRTSNEPQTKKRKRLTGSQKKARKAAKLANAAATPGTGYHTGRVLNPDHIPPTASRTQPSRDDEDDDDDDGEDEDEPKAGPTSPGYQPRSPTFNAPPLSVAQALSAPAKVEREIPPHLVASRSAPTPSVSQPDPQTAQPTARSIPSTVVAKLPVSFPMPPPITPLTGQEPALEPETSENLLEAALWSWYTAGYQTALYHASVGVATFKPSSPTSGDGDATENGTD
ncbi:hypothetical protein JCM11491_002089 [Sporobolomyces phaffii]